LQAHGQIRIIQSSAKIQMNENPHTFSIIVPAYNRAKLLPVCIDSIIKQTYTNWECIIVDDFSSDDTREAVGRINASDKRIRYVPNSRKKGAQGARNTGILEAKGNWIAFNDSDDEWLPDKLARQYEIIREKGFNPFLVIHGNCIVYDHGKNTKSLWPLNPNGDKMDMRFFLKESSIFFPAIVTSKEALLKVGLLDEQVISFQEWDAALSLSRICDFVHVKEPLFIYNQHQEETISKDFRKGILGMNYIRIKYSSDFIRYFDEASFTRVLLLNIHRIVHHKYWDLGIQLLHEDAAFIPAKQYRNWLKSFGLKVDPLKKVSYFSQIRNLFYRIKRKIHG